MNVLTVHNVENVTQGAATEDLATAVALDFKVLLGPPQVESLSLQRDCRGDAVLISERPSDRKTKRPAFLLDFVGEGLEVGSAPSDCPDAGHSLVRVARKVRWLKRIVPAEVCTSCGAALDGSGYHPLVRPLQGKALVLGRGERHIAVQLKAGGAVFVTDGRSERTYRYDELAR